MPSTGDHSRLLRRDATIHSFVETTRRVVFGRTARPGGGFASGRSFIAEETFHRNVSTMGDVGSWMLGECQFLQPDSMSCRRPSPKIGFHSLWIRDSGAHRFVFAPLAWESGRMDAPEGRNDGESG